MEASESLDMLGDCQWQSYATSEPGNATSSCICEDLETTRCQLLQLVHWNRGSNIVSMGRNADASGAICSQHPDNGADGIITGPY